MNGGKSHALRKGAPGPTAQFTSGVRKAAAAQHPKVEVPFDGMQSYKGVACWCKKCAGSTSGKDNHSHMGCSPASAEYPNCKLYKSLSRLSASTKRARTLEGPGDDDGGPTWQRARREDGSALPPEKVDAGATGSIKLFAAHRRAFFAGHHDVIATLDALVFDVEVRAKSELKSAQHQESEDACDAGTANLVARCHKLKAPRHRARPRRGAQHSGLCTPRRRPGCGRCRRTGRLRRQQSAANRHLARRRCRRCDPPRCSRQRRAPRRAALRRPRPNSR